MYWTLPDPLAAARCALHLLRPGGMLAVFDGIPAMVFYAYFRRRVSRMVSLLELAATEIMTLLITRPRA